MASGKLLMAKGIAFFIIVCIQSCICMSEAAGPTIKFEHPKVSGTEGSVFCFHLIAVGPFEEDFAVRVNLVPQTAHHIEDYILIPWTVYISTNTYANFTVGQKNSTTVCIVLVDNNAWEPLELFQMRIEIPSGVKAMLGSPSTSTVNIIDNDVVGVSFQNSNIHTSEDVGQLELHLQAHGIYTDPFSVGVRCWECISLEATVTKSRTSQSDVYSDSHSIHFEDAGRSNSLSSSLVFEIVDDVVKESTESFICLILPPFGTSGIAVTDPEYVTISIVDNDSPQTVEVMFSSSVISVTEGSNVGIKLIAQGTYGKEFTVKLTFQDETASLFRDYLYVGYPTVTPSVTFAPGSLSSSVFNVVAIGNNGFDGQRSFTVGFELPDVPNLDLRKGRPETLKVFITDDDTVAVSFQLPAKEVREYSGSFPIRLNSTGLYSRPFQVPFTCMEVFPVDAKAGEDFESGICTVTFDTTGTLETMSTVAALRILDDRVPEPTQSFTCVILKPLVEDGIAIEDPDAITFSILDDD